MQNTVCFLRCIYRDDDVHHYCGYVGISNENASIINEKLAENLSKEDREWFLYDAIADEISIHGGVTFCGTFYEPTPIIPITNIPENWTDYLYYGFDLNHYMDVINGIDKNIEYAKTEVLSMQKQLEGMIAQYVPSTGN